MIEQAAGALLHDGTVDYAEAPMRLVAEKDILGYAHVRDQIELLVDDADTESETDTRIERTEAATFDIDRSSVRSLGPAEDPHQRRFAGAVFTNQAMDLTAADREINTLQGVDARIGFLDALKIRERRF